MDDVSVKEFLGQMGPSFLRYEKVFQDNEFVDCGTLKVMDIEMDLPMMFNKDTMVMPLGHRRKLEDALRCLRSVDDDSRPTGPRPTEKADDTSQTGDGVDYIKKRPHRH
jgi:hypothetical protein